jgi:hypothetical protein
MVIDSTPTIVVQNRLRGRLGNPVRLLTGVLSGLSLNPPYSTKYTVDSGDDASLVGNHVWQLMRFITSSSNVQDPTSLSITLDHEGVYTFNFMAIIDVQDENRLFALQVGKDMDSPAAGGPFNTATASVMGVGSLSYTTLVEKDSTLKVWTRALSSTTVLNAGDLSYPVLEIVQNL